MKLCMIPARGGSKRIPRKNIKPFLGKPIIAYSIEAALASECFDKVIVSTDDQEIADVARQYGAEVPFLRPGELSDDHAGTVPVIVHAIEWYQAQGISVSQICCLYSTAPFVTGTRLAEAFEQLQRNGADYCFSVTEFDYPIQRALRVTGAERIEMFDADQFNNRSQDLEPAFHDAGQFYWGQAEAFLAGKAVFSEAASPYRLPGYLVQDIDTPNDWIRAELMYQGLLASGQLPKSSQGGTNVNIVIRVDASTLIGSGHVMRCLVLARQLQNLGAEVSFICRQAAGDLIEPIRAQGYAVAVLPEVTEPDISLAEGYARWLGVPQCVDAQQSLAALVDGMPTLVVIDHYALDAVWEQPFRERGVGVVVIDDLANRSHDCQLLIDQNIWPDMQTRYNDWVNADCKRLLGPEFALLREDFARLRQQLPEQREHLLAFFGGTDPTGECAKLLEACCQLQQYPMPVVVISGRFNSVQSKLDALQPQLPEWVQLHQLPPDYEGLLCRARYALGASGSSNWERLCLKIPTTIVSVAENQRTLAHYLGEQAIVRYLGDGEQTGPQDYILELRWIAEHQDDPLAQGKVTLNIDGLGAYRVAEEVIALC